MVAAASVAVVIGAMAGCSADDDLAPVSGITAGQPASPDPGSGPEPESDTSGEAPRTDPELASTEPDADVSDTGGEEAGLAPSPPTTAPQLTSTGPVLEWTEFDPGFDDLFKLESVGDGRVIARAWNDGDRGLFGQRIVVSANGKGWGEIPIPEDLFPDQVNVSADRWVVTGRIPDVDRANVGADRVIYSDDQGVTWTEVAVHMPSEAPSPYASQRLQASSVLVSGERILVVLSALATIDGQALLDDLGLLPPAKKVVFSLPTPDGVSFTLTDVDAPYLYSDLTSAAFGLIPIYGTSVINDEPDLAYDELHLTYDEVGITEDEMFDLFDPLDSPFDILQTRFYVSDGGSGEVAASFNGVISSAAATGEGFVLTAVDDSGGTVLSSPDGLAWSEGPSLGPGFFVGTVSADGTIWTVTPGAGPSLEVQRAGAGEVPATVATLEGLQDSGPPVVGPAGLVLTATAQDVPSGFGNEPAVSRISRDGYELHYNEPEGGLSLWDLADGAAVYVFGPEDMQTDAPPDGVRQVDYGPSIALVFEDPDTGEDLVTFTADDLAFLFGMGSAQSDAASGNEPEWPQQWVGWSADGTRWGWESLADAFGIDEARIWAEFAVGDNFVIARVAAWEASDPAGVSQALPIRWFLATVP